MKAIKKRKKLLVWLTLLAVVLAGAGWWWAMQPKSLRLAAVLPDEWVPFSYIAQDFLVAQGFLTFTRTGYRFRDWHGGLRWHVKPSEIGDIGQLALSPQGCCLAQWLPDRNGIRLLSWHNGILRNQARIRLPRSSTHAQQFNKRGMAVDDDGAVTFAYLDDAKVMLLRLDRNGITRGITVVPPHMEMGAPYVINTASNKQFLVVECAQTCMVFQLKIEASLITITPAYTASSRQVAPTGVLVGDLGRQYRISDGKILPGLYQTTDLVNKRMSAVGLNWTSRYQPVIMWNMQHNELSPSLKWLYYHIPTVAHVFNSRSRNFYFGVVENGRYTRAKNIINYSDYDKIMLQPKDLPGWESCPPIRPFNELLYDEEYCLISADGHAVVSSFSCHKEGSDDIEGTAILRW